MKKTKVSIKDAAVILAHAVKQSEKRTKRQEQYEKRHDEKRAFNKRVRRLMETYESRAYIKEEIQAFLEAEEERLTAQGLTAQEISDKLYGPHEKGNRWVFGKEPPVDYTPEERARLWIKPETNPVHAVRKRLQRKDKALPAGRRPKKRAEPGPARED